MSENSPLPSAVVDTNLFVSGTIIRKGVPNELIRAWRRREFVVVMARRQHQELTDVFTRPKIRTKYNLTDDDLADLLNELRTFARSARLARRIPLHVRDEKDRQIVAAAIGGNADYIISGDNDLLILAGDPRLGSLKIVSARTFLELLASRPGDS
jgi:putative PIN family toxin of toxin-antitoxin system